MNCKNLSTEIGPTAAQKSYTAKSAQTSAMSTSVRGWCYANCYGNLCSVGRKMQELGNRCCAVSVSAAQTQWLSWINKCLHSR